MIALVDHGDGPKARRSAGALAAACSAAAAPAQLRLRLGAALPPSLRCDAVSLSQAAAPAAAGDGADHAQHLAEALRRAGSGSFTADDFMDGSVHNGHSRGDEGSARQGRHALNTVVGGGALVSV